MDLPRTSLGIIGSGGPRAQGRNCYRWRIISPGCVHTREHSPSELGDGFGLGATRDAPGLRFRGNNRSKPSCTLPGPDNIRPECSAPVGKI